ncbi:hypothetical protein BPUTSESOX_2399 [uncultured Gammaproteobacteria bacterium]|jgi:hypothetical protein|nr:hypothetical protein BPUTEOSOX_1040 [thiotrophic endosymbiont of Bathymodiolus puteoserpentis (Logatchev)]VVH51205.1 hypothetical protein BPUTSESOX_2399 [uncultured Gammaproteobacteria bacterium]
MTYFKQLTGNKLPKKEVFTIKNKKTGKIHTGIIYKSVDKNGNNFALRNLSSSKVNNGTTERWTIDVPKEFLGIRKGKEIKFK